MGKVSEAAQLGRDAELFTGLERRRVECEEWKRRALEAEARLAYCNDECEMAMHGRIEAEAQRDLLVEACADARDWLEDHGRSDGDQGLPNLIAMLNNALLEGA